MSPRITKLQEAIQTRHHCGAWYVKSEPIITLSNGEEAWNGVVECFHLVGHPTAQRCYAWSDDDEPAETPCTTVLELPSVDSAESAVKMAMAAHSKR